VKFINIILLYVATTSIVYTQDLALKVTDQGWLKSAHSLCQDQYDFDSEIASNCYKNKKNEKIYALRKVILKEAGHENIAITIDKVCSKHNPLWKKAIKCFDNEMLKYQ